MICKFKSLALLVGSLLALSGLMASTAGAANFTTTAGAHLTGEPHAPYVITATGQTISCSIIELEATAPSSSFKEISFIPVITDCKTGIGTTGVLTGFGHFGEAHEPCHLVGYADGTGDLVCPPGVEVTFEAGTCVIHMPSQAGVKTFTYTNIKREGIDAITIGFNLDNLRGSHTDGFLCPFNGGGTFENTKASGAGIAWGEVGGESVPLSWDK